MLHDIQVQKIGLQIPEETTLEDWKLNMTAFKNAHAAYHECLADLVKFGRRKWPDAADLYINQLEFSFKDMKVADALASIDEPKHLSLGKEVCYVAHVESKGDTALRDQWLETANAESLTPSELQHSMRSGEVVRQDEINQKSGRDSGIPSISGVRTAFDRWFSQVGGPTGTAALSLESKGLILAEWSVMYDLLWALDQEVNPPSEE